MLDTVEIHKDPYGVVLVMGAWNYPIQLSLVPFAGAIAAGNCVILKPSEIAAASAKVMADLIPQYLDRVSHNHSAHECRYNKNVIVSRACLIHNSPKYLE